MKKMKKMKKRFFALCICISLLLSVSCASETASDDTTSPASAETTASSASSEPSYLESLGDRDFNGETFTTIGVHNQARKNFYEEGLEGEVVNDALRARDLFLSETYNVNLVFVPTEDAEKTKQLSKNSILADDGIYDLIIGSAPDILLPMMTDGILFDMNTLPFLDLTREWWSREMYENTRFNGQINIITGDLSPQKFYAPYVMAFNRKLAEDYQLPDMYQLVLDGKWTVDKMLTFTKGQSHDLNGDSVIDYNDFFAYAYVQTNITGNAHFVGAGGHLSQSEGNQVIIDLNTEENVNRIEKLQSFLCEPGIRNFNKEVADQTTRMFLEDRALFFGNSFAIIIADFRNMKSDYGVIPVPKWDEKQEHYKAFNNIWCYSSIGVPKNIRNPEKNGFLMEAMCYKSYEEVRPALIDNVIKQKISRDAANIKVMDLIFDNTYLDMNSLYDFGKSASFIGDCVVGKRDFASGYAKIEKSIEADLKKLEKTLDT